MATEHQSEDGKAVSSGAWLGHIENVSPNSVLDAIAGNDPAEKWWRRHAELLAVKMKLGGVQSFNITRTAKGTYEFEVTPIDWPNVELSDRRENL